MTSLRSLVRRGDTGTPSTIGRRIAIGLAVLTPLLIAGVAVSALQGPAGTEAGAPVVTATPSPAATTPALTTPAATAPAAPVDTVGAGSPLLPAAVVNEDALVYVDGADGTRTPVVIGKVLVSELTSGTSGQGFSWTVTDSGTASSGLASGQFATVVTIPSDFTSSYLSISSSDPVQAQLQVQTNGADSYATGLLASALSTDLQAAVSAQATTQYVTGTLSAFGDLRTDLAAASSGAAQIGGYLDQSITGTDELAGGITKLADEGGAPLTALAEGVADGLGQIAAGTADLPAYADGFAQASSGITGGIGLLESRLTDEATSSYAIDARQQELEAKIATLRSDVPTLSAEEIQARLDSLQLEAAGIRVSSFTVTLGLGLDTLGVTALKDFSGQLSAAQAEFAADIPALTTSLSDAATAARLLAEGNAGLTTGIRDAATGAAGLSSGLTQIAGGQADLVAGLDKAVAAIPDYSADQQTQIATVVSQPIVTVQSDLDAVPTPAAAIAAVAVPLALWIGAFAIYLLLVPFTRRALDSTAGTFRVVVSALAPAALLAVVQAAVVAVVLFAVGAQPAHLAGSILFTLLISVVFVALHQGLVALFGQAGRLLSLALVVVQLAAAAVIIPNGLSSPVYTGLSSLLPLTHAITGMQALIGGGSVAVAAQAAVVLLVFGLIGLLLSLVAARRQRSRNVVVVAPALAAPSRTRGAVTA